MNMGAVFIFAMILIGGVFVQYATDYGESKTLTGIILIIAIIALALLS